MHERVATNGVTLHVVSEGPKDGSLVILLHGFPEYWWGWRHQIKPLAERGYRVLVPDQRGYNTSDKPKGVAAYDVDQLAGDILGLIDAAGAKKASIVGHDWGAIVAWWLALRHPDRVNKLAILNVPHPYVMVKTMFSSLAQVRKSWYVGLFQIPYLAERAGFIQSDGARMAGVLRTTSRPGTFSPEELSLYREAWRQPGAPEAMVNWYRASRRLTKLLFAKPERVRVPAMVIWGARDQALGEEMAPASVALCDEGRLERFEDATHWVHHEEPERVNALLGEFLGPSARA